MCYFEHHLLNLVLQQSTIIDKCHVLGDAAMRYSAIRFVLFVISYSICSVVTAGSSLSPQVTRIPSLIAPDNSGILRIQVQPTFTHNPAGCDDGPDVVDFQLDVPGRSAEEQRQILNAINLAFMTGRNVKFYISDDLCSTEGTSSRLRVVTGVQVLY